MIMQIILYPGPRVTLLLNRTKHYIVACSRPMPLRKIRKEHKTLIKHQYPIFSFFNTRRCFIS